MSAQRRHAPSATQQARTPKPAAVELAGAPAGQIPPAEMPLPLTAPPPPPPPPPLPKLEESAASHVELLPMASAGAPSREDADKCFSARTQDDFGGLSKTVCGMHDMYI